MPDWKKEIGSRLAGLRLAPTREAEIVEELAQHLDDRYGELLQNGATEAEACRAALQELNDGDFLLIEELRQVERPMSRETTVLGAERSMNMLGDFRQDVRYGLRMLLRKPGFTFVAAMTLALGIGANTAIFSVVNAVLLRPLSFPRADEIIHFEGTNPSKGISDSNLSAPDYVDWTTQNQAFAQIGIFATGGAILAGTGDEPERVPRAAVSAAFFPVLGVQPLLGRAFLPEEDRPGSEQVAVLSHNLWKRRFGSNADIIGSKITVSGRSVSVVGVMPPGYDFPQQTQLWTSLRLNAAEQNRDNRSYEVIARLRPGVSVKQAQTEISTINARLAQTYEETNSGWNVRLIRLHERLVGEVRPSLLALLGAVAFVLLIACANVANLLLARAAARRKEIAIRTALGASRLRVVRQLLTESMLLSLIGGAFGLLLSMWLTNLLIAISPADTPRFNEINVDYRVLAFTLGVSCLTGMIFGLAPALQVSKIDLNGSLKDGTPGAGAGGGPRRNRIRSLLVVSEVALSLMLLISAGLLIKSFQRLRAVEPGFNPEHLLTMSISLPSAKYSENQQRADFFRQLVEQVEALPGVKSAGTVLTLPLGGGGFSVGRSFIPEGRAMTTQESANASYSLASPEYFHTLEIPLRAGRNFTERDTDKSPMVVIINETMARRFFGANEEAVGKRLTIWRDEKFPREIVGVVGDTKSATLDGEAGPQMYVPHPQDASWGLMVLVARTIEEPASMTPAIRRAVLALDKDQPIYNLQTMDEVVLKSMGPRRVSMLLFSIFAGVALVLAAVGIYGVVAYSVTQRTHEIGIRMALGAQKRDVLRLVMRQGITPALVGIGAGLIGALMITRLMSSLLYGVSATDPLTFIAISLLLIIVALLACYVPARRATRVDPLIALKYE
ncbi:MAG: ADOP family duplicated permease [Pyrinomonadaceae bacterium]